jgi:mannosyl-3-phosphoglycerate phosphatase
MSSLTAAWWPRSRGLASRLWVSHRRHRLESPSSSRLVLFVDPDTLRDGRHDWTATTHVIRELEDRGIAVVLWGNETRSEMELIQGDLNLQHPFISENGGGLFVPHGYFVDRPAGGRDIQSYDVLDFGKPYHEVAEALHEVARRHECPVVGFSIMSIEDVAREHGLSLAQARLAKLREYDEPFRVADSEPATYSRICSALRRFGYRCFTHERLHHATGVADKAQSIRTLTSLYRDAHDGHVVTIGVAKAPSESCLLHAVDIAIVVRSADVDAARLAEKVPTARLIDASPRGWSEAILEVLDGRVAR